MTGRYDCPECGATRHLFTAPEYGPNGYTYTCQDCGHRWTKPHGWFLRADTCDYGNHPIDAGEPIVWVGHSSHSVIGASYQRRVACVPCFYDRVTRMLDLEAVRAFKYEPEVPYEPDRDNAHSEAARLRWRGIDWSYRWRRTHGVHVCGNCGRQVVAVNDYWSGSCDDFCWRRNYDKDRQLGEPEPRRCVMCPAVFTPTRRDAVYCSPACKQMAYRMRKTGMVLPNGSRGPELLEANGNAPSLLD
jgi:hypothetical protein